MALLNSDSVACFPSLEVWICFGRSRAFFGALPGCGRGYGCGGNGTRSGADGDGTIHALPAIVFGASTAVTSAWHNPLQWRRHGVGMAAVATARHHTGGSVCDNLLIIATAPARTADTADHLSSARLHIRTLGGQCVMAWIIVVAAAA